MTRSTRLCSSHSSASAGSANTLGGDALFDRRGQPGVDVPVGGAVVEDEDGGHAFYVALAVANAKRPAATSAGRRAAGLFRSLPVGMLDHPVQRDVDVAHEAGGRPGGGHLFAEL